MIKITPEPHSFNLCPSLSISLIKGSLIGCKAGNTVVEKEQQMFDAGQFVSECYHFQTVYRQLW